MTRRRGSKTGGDKSKLARALEAKGKSLTDRERNMRPKSGKNSLEHSRVSKKRNSRWV